jgi:hypothetical protein
VRELLDCLEVWDEYESLTTRCDRLLERRQEQLRDAERMADIFGDLETSFPVLAAIVVTVELIDANRTRREASEPLDEAMIL